MISGEEKARALKMAARYLGLKGQSWRGPDAGMEALLERAYGVALEEAQPRHTLVRCAVKVAGGEGEARVAFGPLPEVSSRQLARLLEGCEEGYALLATLGMGLDLAIRRLMVADAALGAALGAWGSALIEVYLDRVLDQEKERLRERGEFLTPRFSPGYGDAPLSMQPGLLALCGAGALGVRLTRRNLMVPEKSVSAVMGIIRRRAPASAASCALCWKTDCLFREEEA